MCKAHIISGLFILCLITVSCNSSKSNKDEEDAFMAHAEQMYWYAPAKHALRVSFIKFWEQKGRLPASRDELRHVVGEQLRYEVWKGGRKTETLELDEVDFHFRERDEHGAEIFDVIIRGVRGDMGVKLPAKTHKP
jgi:hypothetical protein